MKKVWVAGEKVLYSDLNKCLQDDDKADAYVANTAGYLTCGSAGALANFTSLASGANDGAFKTTIDGVEYDISALLQISDETLADQITQATNDSYYNLITGTCSQSFKIATSQATISSITLYTSVASTLVTVSLYKGTPFAGTLIESKTIDSPSGVTTYTFDNEVSVYAGDDYYWTVSTDETNACSVGRADTNVYSDGEAYENSTVKTYDFRFIITGSSLTDVSSLDEVATAIQNAIQSATNSPGTVEYDTDHFIITSGTAGTSSEVSVLSSPDSGTDISGSSYLNGADGTATQGTGGEGKVVSLDEDGKINEDLIPTEVSIDSFTETAIHLTSGITDNAWYDWDLSALIPSTAKYVDIVNGVATNGDNYIGARKDGSSVDRKVRAYYGNVAFKVSVIDSKIIEVFHTDVSDAGTNRFTITGYYE